MNSLLHNRFETASSTAGGIQWNCTKAIKAQQSAGKVMASFLGILVTYCSMTIWKKPINSDYHCALLDLSKEEITRKRPHLLKKRCIILQDNTPAHKSISTWHQLINCALNCLPSPLILYIWPPATISCSQP